MALMSLKINIVSANSTKTMQFDPQTMVFDVCRVIREKNPEANSLQGQPMEYGLFLADEDPKKGVWLESGKTLEHYLLRAGDLMEYRKKIRPLRVKMLDGSIKTVLIDDSNTVSQMLVTICTRLGITNYDEYSLCRDIVEEEKKDATLNRATLKKEKEKSSILRDEKRMETLKKKLHTDDELNWLDHTRTLREQGVEDVETLIFRRKYFYSDQNIDKRDPVQLNLLYVQSRDAIINGTHPASLEESTQLAGTQSQIQYGDHNESKHKQGFLELKTMLPKEYVKVKGVEKKIFVEHRKLIGVTELDAKVRYTQLCRSLKTYGITFFLVKEKMKGKNKLVPRLLGINKESVVRVDERTKEILKTWPLTTVRRWAASPKSFTLDFGDYSDSYYSVQTTEGEAIGALIAGYIDIILKKQKGKDRMGLDGEEEATLLEDSVSPAKATFIQHQSNKVGHVATGSVALPAVLRAGGQAGTIQKGEMESPIQSTMVGQVHQGHQAPLQEESFAKTAPVDEASCTAMTAKPDESAQESFSKLDELTEESAPQEESFAKTAPVDEAACTAVTAKPDESAQESFSKLDELTEESAPQEEMFAKNVPVEEAAITPDVRVSDESAQETFFKLESLEEETAPQESFPRLIPVEEEACTATIARSDEQIQDNISKLEAVTTELEQEVKEYAANAAKQPGLTNAQHGLQGNIEQGFTAVDAARNELQSMPDFPQLGSDPASKQWRQNTMDTSREAIQSQLSAMSAATAGIISLTSGDPSDTDYTSVGSHVTTISSNLTELTKGVKMLSALLGDDAKGDKLLDAARGLMDAFSDLLKSAQPGSGESRQSMLNAANRVGEAQNQLLKNMGSPSDVDPRFQDALLALAKAVANATAALVLKAKNVAATTEDQGMQNQVIGSATQCALNTSQLVACTKVVAPTISSPACQEQLVEAAKLVAKSVEGVVQSSKMATEDENLLRGVGEAATAVTKALNDLLQHVKAGTGGKPGSQYDDACDRIMTATDKLFSSVGNAGEMVRQAKMLAQATSLLVNAIKGDAQGVGEGDSQKRLLGAAKQLADATARMVEAAKACASSPNDADQQQRLRQAAEDLRTATNAAANNALKKKLINRLENAAKQAAALSTQTIAAAQGAGASNTNPGSQQAMIDECRCVAEHIPKLVQGVRDSMAQPDNPGAQLNLINASQNFIQPAAKMVAAAKSAIPTINDQATAMQLTNCTKTMISALADLRSAAQKAQEACGALEIDNALDMIKALEDELNQIKVTAKDGKLMPLPGETTENSASRLGSTSKAVGASMAQLLTAAVQANENYTGIAARDTANALKNLTGAVRGVAANTQDRPNQDMIVDRAKDVMDKSANLLGEAKKALQNPNSPDNQQRLAQVAKAVSHALNNCMNCLPGQRDVDKAIKSVVEASKGLMSGRMSMVFAESGELSEEVLEAMLMGTGELAPGYLDTVPLKGRGIPGSISYDYPVSARPEDNTASSVGDAMSVTTWQHILNIVIHGPRYQIYFRIAKSILLPETDARNYQEHQNALNQSAQGLNIASSELVTASRGTPEELSGAANNFSTEFQQLMSSGMGMAGAAPNKQAQGQMVGSLKGISVASSKLLLAVKSMSADPNAPNAKNALAAAARAVTESINKLINTFMQSAPGQKECDNALRNIQTVKGILDNINEPINECSYFECLEGVMNKSKDLGESMAGITQHAKNGQLDNFGKSVESAGTAVCGLTEAAAQSAYLVGISDPSSVAGRPGLVDQSQFARAHQAIQAACQSLLNPESNQQQVLSAATEVAKHTSALCNICRVASSKTSNPVAKKHFVQSAKDVANSTANLVKSIKALDGNFSEENRQKCAESTKPLLEAVESLVTFASSPEFASVPAKITPQAREAMEPIVMAGKMMIASSCALIQTAKPLAINPKDPPTWQLLANHSKNVSDSIKKLVSSIRDRAPGQSECDEAIEKVNQSIRDLDQGSLAAISQNLAPHAGGNLKHYTEQLANSAAEIRDVIDQVTVSSKGHAEKLGHAVSSMGNYFLPLTRNAIGAASKTQNSQRQMALLDQCKTVAESALQLLYAAKEGGGNPKAVHTHSAIDEAATGMREAVDDLNVTLEEAASEFGIVSGMVDNITKAMGKTDDLVPETEAGEFVDYQTNMVKCCKAIIKLSQDMVTKANSNVGELGAIANNMTHEYDMLATQSRGAAASSNPEVARRIRTAVQDCGNACIELVKSGGTVQCNPTDNLAKKDLVDNARGVTEKTNYVMAALQAGSRGTQACINAASTVSGIIGDLDTTIMFASAGTLSAEPDGGAFGDHSEEARGRVRESILKTAKALVEDTKTLVSGAASSQEKLADAAQSAVATITRLADVVKLGAATLGGDDPEGQVMLINAVKDVASALGDLISATKTASGKNVNDPAMGQLKNSAKVMVTNVTSLLKTVKSVEDEATRGTRALEATIDAIVQEARILDSPAPPDRKASPEDLIRSTKAVTLATAKAVGAGNSGKQDDIIAASNLGRQAVFIMLDTCRGAAAGAELPELRDRTLYAGRQCGDAYRSLLEQVHNNIQRQSPDGKQRLAQHSKRVAHTVGELVQAAEALKGSDWIDPEDPNVIAENELLSAANAIEAAAKKLAQLKPRKRTGPRQADESLNFEEQILEAAKAIANATSALVKAASAAQRELVQQGKIVANPSPYSEDGQWSMGLISAARKVAAATQGLCDAANAVVQGHASQERLISSAKQVASSTAQLLVACKVKADTFSEPMRRLQAAGNAVKRASDNLVKAAQQASEFDEEQQGVEISQKMVGNIAIEIEAQEAILKKEKELKDARRKLEMIRKAKYGNKPPGESDSD